MKRNEVPFREGTFVILIRTAGVLGKLDLAIQLFHELESDPCLTLNDRVFGAMIDACCKVGDLEKARDYFKRMKEVLGMSSDVVYATMLSGYANRVTQDSSVLSFVDELLVELDKDGLKANVYIYSALMKIYGAVGQFEKVQNLLHEMHDQKVTPDAAVYNTYLTYMGYRLNSRQVNELYQEMKALSVRLDDYTCNLILRVFARSGDPNGALEFIKELEKHGIKSTAITYNTLIHAYINAAKSADSEIRTSDLCHQIYLKMKKSGLRPDRFTYHSLLAACSISGDHTRTLMYLYQMNQAKIKPSAMTYTTLIDLYARHSDPTNRRKYLKTCFSLLKQMERNQVSMDTRVFASMISACAKVKAPDHALKLISRMKAMGLSPDRYIYNSLIRLWTSVKNTEEAFSVFDAMIAEGIIPDVITFTSLFQILSEQNDSVRILKLLERMQEMKVRPNAVTKRVIKRLDKSHISDEIMTKIEQLLT
eukprot:g4269.t1